MGEWVIIFEEEIPRNLTRETTEVMEDPSQDGRNLCRFEPLTRNTPRHCSMLIEMLGETSVAFPPHAITRRNYTSIILNVLRITCPSMCVGACLL